MRRFNLSKLTLLAMGPLLLAACLDGGPTASSPGAATVDVVRARATSRWARFLAQDGLATVIATSTTTSPLGQQVTSTQVINFWKKGPSMRAEFRDTGSGDSALQVASGQTLRMNNSAKNLTQDVFIDHLKPINQTKWAHAFTFAKHLFELAKKGTPQLSEDPTHYYLSVGPIERPVIGNLWTTWTIDKPTYDVSLIESHIEGRDGTVRDLSYTFTKTNLPSNPDSLFALPPKLGNYRDSTPAMDAYYDMIIPDPNDPDFK